MIDELAADIEPALRLRYGRAKSAAEVDRTAAALGDNGFVVRRAATTAEAKELVLSLIPDGAEVLHGASRTLQLTRDHGGDRAVRTLQADTAANRGHGPAVPGR